MTTPNRKPPDPNVREFCGTISEIKWSDPETGAVIATLRSGHSIKGSTGGQGELEPGMAYRFLGRWENHHRYGDQFSFQTFVREVPHHHDGIIKYLVDTAPNVGRITAERLWHRFGADAVSILRESPELVAAEKDIGLTENQCKDASEALAKVDSLEKTKIDLFTLFAGRGFPGSLVNAAIHKWGARAAERIRRNPFALMVAELPGCGFKRTDKLYLDLKFPAHALKRQMLCCWNALRSDSDGNTWQPISTVVEAIERAIPNGLAQPAQACRLGKRAGWISTKRDEAGKLWVAEAKKAKHEATIVRKVLELSSAPVLWPSLAVNSSPLSEHQRKRAGEAMSAAVGILAGSPGTGKTFSAAQVILRVIEQYGKEAVAVCGPTGKSAVRITEAMRNYGILDVKATTVHRLLEIGRNGHDGAGWGFQRNESNPLDQRFIFLDEASMVDSGLMADLLLACAPGTQVLLIGDPGQLSPVGHGAPLRDMIAAGVPCGELSEIRRNAGLIVHACARIKAGEPWEVCDRYDPEKGDNLRLIETAGGAAGQIEALKTILQRFRDSGKFDPVWDCQVLVAMNAKSQLGRIPLNKALQVELNAAGQQCKDNPFRTGDKIICLKNTRAALLQLKQVGQRAREWTVANGYGATAEYPPDRVESYIPLRDQHAQPAEDFLANGEIGRVLAVAPKVAIAAFPSPDRIVKVLIGKVKTNEDGEATGEDARGCDYDLAYAVTCHKLQGSEAPVVIVMIDEHTGASRVASKEWVYTALSRASKLCVLIGKKGVIDKQARRASLVRRKTFLRELLIEAATPAATSPATPEVTPPETQTPPKEILNGRRLPETPWRGDDGRPSESASNRPDPAPGGEDSIPSVTSLFNQALVDSWLNRIAALKTDAQCQDLCAELIARGSVELPPDYIDGVLMALRERRWAIRDAAGLPVPLRRTETGTPRMSEDEVGQDAPEAAGQEDAHEDAPEMVGAGCASATASAVDWSEI